MTNVTVNTFGGQAQDSFRLWAKKVRAFCNGKRPGFENILQCVEPREGPVTWDRLQQVDWQYKNVVNDVLYDFRLLHTFDVPSPICALWDLQHFEAAWSDLDERAVRIHGVRPQQIENDM